MREAKRAGSEVLERRTLTNAQSSLQSTPWKCSSPELGVPLGRLGRSGVHKSAFQQVIFMKPYLDLTRMQKDGLLCYV